MSDPKAISENLTRGDASALAALGKKSSRLYESEDGESAVLIDDEAGRWWTLKWPNGRQSSKSSQVKDV